jgi:hypothetical protein
MADVSRNDGESGTVTRELEPLKLNAFPNLPLADQVVFAAVPEFPLPDASATVDPDPSSNPNAATSPGVAGVPLGATTRAHRSAAATTLRKSAGRFPAQLWTTRCATPI